MTLFAAAALALRFVAESVAIEALEDDFSVEARYTFARDGGGSGVATIEYPFLGGFADPDSLRVSGADLLAADARRALLRLTFPSGATRATVWVRFRQALGKRRVGYLVTTALAWGAPVGEASFTVRAPRSWGAPRATWRLPAARCTDQHCAWSWSLRDFRPTVELEARWATESSR